MHELRLGIVATAILLELTCSFSFNTFGTRLTSESRSVLFVEPFNFPIGKITSTPVKPVTSVSPAENILSKKTETNDVALEEESLSIKESVEALVEESDTISESVVEQLVEEETVEEHVLKKEPAAATYRMDAPSLLSYRMGRDLETAASITADEIKFEESGKPVTDIALEEESLSIKESVEAVVEESDTIAESLVGQFMEEKVEEPVLKEEPVVEIDEKVKVALEKILDQKVEEAVKVALEERVETVVQKVMDEKAEKDTGIILLEPTFPVQITPDDKEVEKLLKNYGEESRKYRRDVFSAADWIRSRRPDRFVNNLATTLDSGLIRQLSFELKFVTASSVFISAWNNFLVEGYQDLTGFQHEKLFNLNIPALVLPSAPFSLSVAALGLLLTFRTNVSYSRWNEARTAWGKVINDSRSIARMGCTWARSYKHISNDDINRLGEAVCSFSRTLMNRLLSPQEDEANYREYLQTRITDKTYAQNLLNAKHRPTAALAEISEILVEFNLNPIHQVEVEKAVTGLCDALGASERIFTSPVPTFYTRHTARFLAFWLMFLPLSLYEPFKGSWNHWGMVPATVVISAFMLGIEELATQMEEPFSILPMEKMTEGSIRTSVMEQVERSQKKA